MKRTIVNLVFGICTLIAVSATALGLPYVSYADYTEVQLNYTVSPQTSNTIVNNAVSMTTDAEGTTNDQDCVQVGTVDPKSGCGSSSNNDLIAAGKAIEKAAQDCTSTKGMNLSGAVMTNAASCMQNELTQKYPQKAQQAVTDAVASATNYSWYQCVGFVENALTLIGVLQHAGYWSNGSSVYGKPPSAQYVQVTADMNHGLAEPGDIFSYGTPADDGHVGIVLAVPAYGMLTVLDANEDYHGSITEHQLPYLPGDVDGANKQPRFLRNTQAQQTPPPNSDWAQKIQDKFNIVMYGFTDEDLQWAYNKLSSISNTDYVSVVTSALTGGPLYIQNAVTDPNKTQNDGQLYDTTHGWSATLNMCHGGSQNSPNIWLLDQWPYASSADRQGYFDITLLHEMGHVVQDCQKDSQSHVAEMTQLYKQYGGLSFYAQHSGQPTCPNADSGVVQEDYSDAVSYYLNQEYSQKIVCGQSVEPQRPPNPYTTGSDAAQAYAVVVREILGL